MPTLLILVIPLSSHAQTLEIPVIRSQFYVNPGASACSSGKLNTFVRHGRIAGNTMVLGGPSDSIRVLVLREIGGQSTILFDSGQRRSVVLSVPVSEPGTYSVCFDNKSSIFSTATVRADIRLVHEGEDFARAEAMTRKAGERQRRVGQILGKLVSALRAMEKNWGTKQVSPPIYIQISDDPTVNAFADWSRKLITVNRGTLEYAESLGPTQRDNVLAGVLGHELAHIFYRHSYGDPAEQAAETVIAGSAGALMIHPLVGFLAAILAYDKSLRYDREQEKEADLLGIRLVCDAGFDAAGPLTFMARVGEENPAGGGFLQNHPSPADRLEYLRQEVNSSCF